MCLTGRCTRSFTANHEAAGAAITAAPICVTVPVPWQLGWPVHLPLRAGGARRPPRKHRSSRQRSLSESWQERRGRGSVHFISDTEADVASSVENRHDEGPLVQQLSEELATPVAVGGWCSGLDDRWMGGARDRGMGGGL